MRNRLSVASIAIVLTLGGCASMSEGNRTRDTAIGAGVGASAGAIIGALAGQGTGAAIGAAAGAGVGAIAGNVWSRRMEDQKKEMEQATTAESPRNVLICSCDETMPLDADAVKRVCRGTQVTIIGHTDSSGSDAVNNPLSLNRAASTRDYLVSRGVSSNRMIIDGRGSREPVVANDTPANRAKNRRVEIFVAEQVSPR